MPRDRSVVTRIVRASLITASLAATCVLAPGCATGSTTEIPDQALTVVTRNTASIFSGSPQRSPATAGSSELVQKVFDAARKDTRSLLVHDPRLDAVAEACAEIYARRKAWPSSQTMKWLMWKVGVVAQRVNGRFSRREGKLKTRRIDKRLRQDAAGLTADGETLIFGVARVSFGGSLSQALVYARRPLALDPLPKRHQPGSQVTLSGVLDEAHGKLRVAVSRDLGKVQKLNLTLGQGRRFEHTMTLPETPGAYFVELRAGRSEDARGQRRQVAMFPLYVGVDEPESFELATPLAQAPKDKDAWQRTVVQVYNAERARFGLPPLQVEPALRDYVMSEVDRLRAGHKLSNMTEATARVEQAGVKVGHHLWRGGTEAKLQVFLWENLQTPTVRSILLDPTPPVFAVAFAAARDQTDGFHFVQYIGKRKPAAGPVRGDVGASATLSSKASDLINLGAEPAMAGARERTADEQTQTLVRGVLDAIDVEVRQGLKHDPSLDTVAAVTARLYGEDQRWPGRQTMRWLFDKAGVTARYDKVHFRRSSGQSRDARLDQHLVESAHKLKVSAVPKVFGVARLSVNKHLVQAIVIGSQRVQLEPVQKKQEPGASFTVRGVVEPLYHDAFAVFDRGGGDVESRSLELDGQGRFALTLNAPSKPGTYYLDLRAFKKGSKKLGRTFLTHLPIYVETEEPHTFDPAKRWEPLPEGEPSTWSPFITKAFNEKRAALGLPPLQTSPYLQAFVDEQARKRSEGEPSSSRPELYTMLEQQGLGVGEYDYLSSGRFTGLDVSLWNLDTAPLFQRVLVHQKATVFAIAFARSKDTKFGIHQALYIGDVRVVDEADATDHAPKSAD